MRPSRFEVFTSVMIAIVSICSALTAWRAAEASIAAGDADFNGFSSSIRAQEARIFNAIRAYEHYRAFTTYLRYDSLGDNIVDTSQPEAAREQSELWGLALGLQYTFFPSRYLNPSGRYEVQREIDELWAESRALDDLNAAAHFASADIYREKGSLLTASLMVFAGSFFMFALSQAFENRIKYLFALAGVVLLLGGICVVSVFEFGY